MKNDKEKLDRGKDLPMNCLFKAEKNYNTIEGAPSAFLRGGGWRPNCVAYGKKSLCFQVFFSNIELPLYLWTPNLLIIIINCAVFSLYFIFLSYLFIFLYT